MSILFSTMKIGDVEIKNRFVRAPRSENLATEAGEVTDRTIALYDDLVQGGVGLIITGMMYSHPSGRALRFQAGIDRDALIPGLSRMVDAVHRAGGKIFFQIADAGLQTTKELIGRKPLAPSGTRREPVHFVKPRPMNEQDIREFIAASESAAQRAAAAGADGVQIGAAGGGLINQFLSPFFNHRKDGWGGSAKNRFRFLEEIVVAMKNGVPKGMPITVKINADDCTPKEGITPDLAKKYAGWLADLGIDGLEIASGTMSYSHMHMWLGELPLKEYLQLFPRWNRLFGWMALKKTVGKYGYQEAWNLEAAKSIKPVIGNIPLLLAGGLCNLARMEEIVAKGYADFISLARPLIRDPFLVNKFKERTATASTCFHCNKCVAAAAGNRTVRCYHEG